MTRLGDASSKAILYRIMEMVETLFGRTEESLVLHLHRKCLETIEREGRIPTNMELEQVLRRHKGLLSASGLQAGAVAERITISLSEIPFGREEAGSPASGGEGSVERVFLDDLDSFSKAQRIHANDASTVSLSDVYEDAVKSALADIISERFVPGHSCTEKSDLYTTTMKLRGRTVPTAFLLKSMRSVDRMDLKHGLGRRSNQILRLVTEPALLYVIQHTGQIDTDVITDLESHLFKKAKESGQQLYYYIMDGNETARVLRAYGKA